MNDPGRQLEENFQVVFNRLLVIRKIKLVLTFDLSKAQANATKQTEQTIQSNSKKNYQQAN